MLLVTFPAGGLRHCVRGTREDGRGGLEDQKTTNTRKKGPAKSGIVGGKGPHGLEINISSAVHYQKDDLNSTNNDLDVYVYV